MDALKQYVNGLYWQPLDPSTETPLKDRAKLAYESIRPWKEFFDISNFNLPPLNQAAPRLQHNIKTYMYNYLFLACVHIVFFSLVHFVAAFAMVCWLALMYIMFVKYPQDIEFTKFKIDSKMKTVIAILMAVLALFVGHVLTLFISLSIFVLIVVGVHGFVRDDTSELIMGEGEIEGI